MMPAYDNHALYIVKNIVKGFNSMKSNRLPCKLLEYFQAKPAVNNAPKALPVTPYCTASLAVLN